MHAVLSAENSVRFYRALLAKKVPAELHIFAKGAHGSGLGSGDPQLDQWPVLMEGWLRQQGFLERPAKPIVPAAVDEGPLSLESSLGRLLSDERTSSLLRNYAELRWLSDPAVSRYPAGMMLGMDFKISDRDLRDLDSKLRSLRK